MSPRINEILDLERRKLSLLRTKVADQERRVKVLETLLDDPLDALLERELTHPVEPQTPTQAASEPVAEEDAHVTQQDQAPVAQLFNWNALPRNPRRVPPIWVQLLRYIGAEGKTYDDVKRFIQERELRISEGAVRTQLMNYRKEFGFVESPKKGFYKATERALSFIDAQEGGGPALPGGAPQPQLESLARAAA